MKIDNPHLVGGPQRIMESREKVVYEKSIDETDPFRNLLSFSMPEDAFSMPDNQIANILQHNAGFKGVVCVGCEMTVNMQAKHSDFQCPRCEHNNLQVTTPGPEHELMSIDSDVLKHPTPIHERPDIGPSIERMEEVAATCGDRVDVRNLERMGDMVVESTPGVAGPDRKDLIQPALEVHIPASGKVPTVNESRWTLRDLG